MSAFRVPLPPRPLPDCEPTVLEEGLVSLVELARKLRVELKLEDEEELRGRNEKVLELVLVPVMKVSVLVVSSLIVVEIALVVSSVVVPESPPVQQPSVQQAVSAGQHFPLPQGMSPSKAHPPMPEQTLPFSQQPGGSQ